MKRPDDNFTKTEFYRERESRIMARLQRRSIPVPPSPGKPDGHTFDLSDAIYYSGCVAGSLGLPVDSESMRRQLEMLRANAKDGEWPVIAALLCELYERANEESIAEIRADPALRSQPWANVRLGQPPPTPAMFEGQPPPPSSPSSRGAFPSRDGGA